MLFRNRVRICSATSQLTTEGNQIFLLPWGVTDEDVTDVSPPTHRVQSCYRYVDTAVWLRVAAQPEPGCRHVEAVLILSFAPKQKTDFIQYVFNSCQSTSHVLQI